MSSGGSVFPGRENNGTKTTAWWRWTGISSSDCTLAPVLTFEARMTFITRVIIVPLEPQFSIISSNSLLSSFIGWLPPCYSFPETGIWLVAHVADTCTAAITATRLETNTMCFFFFFFDLREIYSVWDAFLPWPSSILAECASEKMHIMTAFSFELVVCVFAQQLWCLWRFLVSVYCTEMVAGNSSLLENLGWRPPKRELFSHCVCRGLMECKQRNKKWTKSCGKKKTQVSGNEM